MSDYDLIRAAKCGCGGRLCRLTADDHRHGTRNGYVNLGCRCQPCRDAQAVWQYKYMHANPWQQRLHTQRECARNQAGLSHQKRMRKAKP